MLNKLVIAGVMVWAIAFFVFPFAVQANPYLFEAHGITQFR